MKVLVCGGLGFQGKNIIEHFLNRGDEVIATYRPKGRLAYYKRRPDFYKNDVDWRAADLTKPHDVKAAFYRGVDVVFHYAAVTTNLKDGLEKPQMFVTDNVIMNSLLMREAHETGTQHFIFPSCTVMYKDIGKPVTEKDFNGLVDETNIYYGGATTKVYTENMCKFYANLGRTKFSVLRQTNIIGKHDKTDLDKAHFFASMIQKIKSADKEFSVWGDGKEEKDLLAVNDLMRLLETLVEKQTDRFDLLNVASGETKTIKSIVGDLVDVFDKDLNIKYDLTKPSKVNKLKLDITKVKDKYGWYPKTTIKEVVNELKENT